MFYVCEVIGFVDWLDRGLINVWEEFRNVYLLMTRVWLSWGDPVWLSDRTLKSNYYYYPLHSTTTTSSILSDSSMQPLHQKGCGANDHQRDTFCVCWRSVYTVDFSHVTRRFRPGVTRGQALTVPAHTAFPSDVVSSCTLIFCTHLKPRATMCHCRHTSRRKLPTAGPGTPRRYLIRWCGSAVTHAERRV